MLSLIISSHKPDYFAAAEKNIAETCGIPYEIIQIKNPGLMGICEAYNKGAEQAKYENLLFIHEDLLFETQDWGNILVDYLKDENLGCIGVAGANYIPHVPTSWWVVKGYAASHIAHFNNETQKRYDYTFKGNEKGLFDVKFIDGVFIGCRKDVWQKNKFDERLKDFHAYDISFSLKINTSLQNFITNKISIVHFSPGTLSKEWLNQLIYNRELNAEYFSQKIIDRNTEFEAYFNFVEFLRQKRFSKKERLTFLLKYFNLSKLGVIGSFKALRFIYWIYKY
ncbi:glycosyltransferase [Moheibacter sediminis]|uniref:Glycosyltransferase like family protein n=1 Tax=Moheibacter sediminis TaxID=1434700 RepID=A0A1W1YX76_9FLAO|nr:glycosyltransferase [Moheibacter sediminis]SMC40779.1 Glycosyltransferase like family protein [Moheibacter sediminis]